MTQPPLSRRRVLQMGGATMVVTGAGVFSMTSARAQTGFRMQVLHINDLHSRVESISKYDNTCGGSDLEEGNCFGGYGRLATKIRARRAELDDAGLPHITLDAGDQFQGSLFYTTYRGQAEVEFMNMIGFDAMAVGNHEFDNGPDTLAEFVRVAEFPVISGNTRVGSEEALAELIQPSIILDVGGERIGILSVLTPNTAVISSPGPNVTFDDEIEFLQQAVADMRADGVTKVLLLSHVGFARDQEIAAAVDGISAIIGGHSHTLLSNTVEGSPAYATMVSNPSGRAVPIVQAYAYSRYLGDLELEFDDQGYVIAATGDTILLDNTVEPDAEIEERIAALAGPIEQMKMTAVAELSASIDGSRESCRAVECEMGNTVTDAMLDRVADQGVTIALTNGGGLRASLPSGTVTVGDVLTVLPFQNTLATVSLTGATIVAALEHGVSGIEEGAGRFPQVAGLRFKLDAAAEPGSRVSEVEVRDGDGWTAIDEGASYSVVTNNFMLNGGDGYAMIRDEGADGYVTAIDMADSLAEYLAENAPFAPEIDGRILQ